MKKVLILTTLVLLCSIISCDKNKPEAVVTGVTFSRINSINPPFNNIESNIVDYNEILGYDSTKYIFLLSDEAGKRIRKEKYPVSPIPFGIAVDGEVIYVANFIPGYSSMSCDQCITIEPYSYDNRYRVVLGYPSSTFYSGIDPRNDSRIISRLKRDNKLIMIDK